MDRSIFFTRKKLVLFLTLAAGPLSAIACGDDDTTLPVVSPEAGLEASIRTPSPDASSTPEGGLDASSDVRDAALADVDVRDSAIETVASGLDQPYGVTLDGN